MSEPLISVIIPVYNTERYLAACLESVLSQSYRNIEVIIINDGSTDFSLQIAETYQGKDDRIKIYSYENEGQAEARNHGLSVATGDLISFVDSDDLLLPNSLQILKNIIDNNPKIDISEGEIIKDKGLQELNDENNIKIKLFSSHEAIENILYQRELLPSPCGKLYKTKLFNDIKFKKGIIYEDLDIFYKVYEKAKKISYINTPVYVYRTNDESTLHTWKPQRTDVLDVTENIEKYLSEKYPDLLPAAKDRRLSANFNMFSLCSIHGEKEKAQECWAHIKANRNQSLFNPKVRLKNKAGILLSYFGKNAFNFVSRIIYSK